MASFNIANKKNSDHTYGEPVEASLVYMNDGIRVCAEACACCWDTPLPDSYEDKVTYLAKRAKIGHTSVFEHSNIITLINLGNKPRFNEKEEMADAMASFRYLNGRFAEDSKQNTYLLIGGTYRGYDEAFKRSKDPSNNSILRAISSVLYANVNSGIFYDLVNKNILNEELFTNVEPDSVSRYFNHLPETVMYEDDHVKFVSVDNINQIRANLIDIIGEDIFTNDDIGYVASMTILFKDMSRTATHQLVRHRNGITQESQRYVDYSNSTFADPATFKPDKYDPSKIYTVEFGGQKFEMTSMEIGEAIIGLYENVRNQGMLKEDARAFLPGNVKCRKLYMTFTYATFMKFLELRCDTHAQAEIRTFANSCKTGSLQIFENLKEDVVKHGVDEIMSKEETLKAIVNNTDELKGE